MQVLITFHTTFNVLKLEKYAQEAGIPGQIRPVPRRYSANCGLAWIGPGETREALQQLIEAYEIEIDNLYEIED